ncbi:MAG: cytochrome c3 family protein [bacterium]
MKKTLSIVLAVVLTFMVAGFLKRQDTKQPIAYSHSIHVEENDMECLDCHQYAEENPRASIPNIDLCAECHEEAMTESEAELALLQFVTEKTKIPWRQIYRVADYAYFSHRRHVRLGELECTVCHGDVGTLTTPVGAPVQEITMAWCMDCHETREVSNDCYACHR